MARVRPLGDRVLVRVLSAERVTPGGVHLPDTMREQSDRGFVLAVGPGSPQAEPVMTVSDGVAGSYLGEMSVSGYKPGTRSVPVEVGEVVLFSPYAGSKVTVGDDEMLLLREHDILGVLDGVEVEQDPDSGAVRLKPEVLAH